MASGRVNDVQALVSYTPEGRGLVNDTFILVSYTPVDQGHANDTLMLVSYVTPAERVSISGVLVEYAVSELDSDCSLAAKPGTYMIFPDPKLNRSGVNYITSQAGPYPGSTVSAPANLGRLLPVQSGEYQVGAEDLVLQVQDSGGTGKATYVWRQDSEAVTDFKGVDDPRYWHGFHDADRTGLIGSGNTTSVYHTQSNRIILYTGTTLSNVGKIGIGYRTPEDRYDDWTIATTFSTEKEFAIGNHGLAAIGLPDGRVMVVQRVDGEASGPLIDFDVYHSEDGLDFTRVCKSLVERFDTDFTVAHNVDNQIRLAISGEYIRLCFADTSHELITYVSQDRGMSWKRLTNSNSLSANNFIMYNTGDTDDDVPFDIVGVNDNGNFVLFTMKSTGAGNQVVRYIGDQDQDWWVPGTLDWTASNTNLFVKAIFAVRGPTYTWMFAYAYDKNATESGEHEWMMVRVEPSNYLKLDGSWQRHSRTEQDGAASYPGRVNAIWCGSQMVFWGSAKAEVGGTDTADGSCWVGGGWTNRSFGAKSPSDDFATYATDNLMVLWWVSQQLEPSASIGTGWTKNAAGTPGTGTAIQKYLTLVGAAAADIIEYTHTFADDGWGTAGKAVVFAWEVSVDSGDSNHGGGNVAVEIRASDGVNRYWVTVYHGPTTTRLTDNGVGTVGDLAIAIDSGTESLTRFRLAVDTDGGVITGQLSALNNATGLWVSVSGVITTLPSAGSQIKFGHLGQAQATTMTSHWREVAIAFDSANESAGLRELGFVNPDDLIGQVCNPSSNPPRILENGIQVAWAGAGGAAGDEFDIDVAHIYGVESMFADSPRLHWKSGGVDPQAIQTIILDAGVVGSTPQTWNHDSIALIGTADRLFLIDYDTSDAFSFPTTGGTVSMDAFETGDVALSVSSVANQEITFDTTGVKFTTGELASTSSQTYYVRAISGAAVNKTWKVTEHPVLGTIVCGDESSLVTEGLAANDSVIIFTDRGAIKYDTIVSGYRYMRIRMLDTDTATGDHRIGAIVPNVAHTMAVPLEWAHTDNEQPNITNYRTRGAIQWAYEEGPPQRTLVSRIVGDASQRERDKLRFQLRKTGYELRPICIVMDSARPVESMVYGRVVSGSQFDNAAYYDDSGVLRAAGDMSFQFVEET